MRWIKRLLAGLVGLLAALWFGVTVYAYWPSGMKEVPAASLATPEDRFVMVDGVAIRYRTWGTPARDKPTALLIHGFANSLQSFRRLAPLLTSKYFVVAYDMPGFGLSDKPAPFDYQNAHQAQIGSHLVKALGLTNVVVGGHSLGGAIALRVALESPEVVGLVVMNPGIISSGVPAIAKYLVFPFPRLQAKIFGDEKFRGKFLRQSFINQSLVTDAVVKDLSRTSHTEGYLQGMTSMMGQYNEPGEVAMLPQLTLPSLIVWGMLDKNKPKGEFESLRAQLPFNTAVKVSTSGHYVQEEAPVETAVAMNTFADRLRALPGAATLPPGSSL